MIIKKCATARHWRLLPVAKDFQMLRERLCTPKKADFVLELTNWQRRASFAQKKQRTIVKSSWAYVKREKEASEEIKAERFALGKKIFSLSKEAFRLEGKTGKTKQQKTWNGNPKQSSPRAWPDRFFFSPPARLKSLFSTSLSAFVIIYSFSLFDLHSSTRLAPFSPSAPSITTMLLIERWLLCLWGGKSSRDEKSGLVTQPTCPSPSSND